MITKEQLAELTSLARAATPGPWANQTSNGWRRVGTAAASRGRIDGDVVANGAASPANMAYIAAANPAMVLALLDRIAELERERDHWMANHDNQVQRARILIERPDMPLERVKAYERYAELERDSARLDYMIENGLFVEAFIMPDLPKMPPLCWLVNFKTGPIVKKQFEDPRAAIDAAMQPPRCTCPSGDGSLRWPCPRHPPGAK
ncbi:ead/Ea22-like family protein [Chromobacterium sp.]|uniref:ead/Ea22-like family protein n=1 Tax=Chromobacterium sp. TaxID=306190 RepID=UPI0035B4D195